MLGRNESRKALALALSRLVLSPETILRHAQTVLRAPELVEIPARASALGLWMAVLQRAEAEGNVEPLVGAVLEENPAAETLRLALQSWSLEEASARLAPAVPYIEPRAERTGSTHQRAAAKRAAALRLVLLIAGGLVLASRLVYWQVREREGSNSERFTAQRAAPLHGPRAGRAEPTDRELEERLLDCWRSSEGGDPNPPASSVEVRLARGTPGERDQVVFSGFPPSIAPRFEGCARAAVSRLLVQMTPGLSVAARIALPTHRTDPGRAR